MAVVDDVVASAIARCIDLTKMLHFSTTLFLATTVLIVSGCLDGFTMIAEIV
jgi:hypothetical protein